MGSRGRILEAGGITILDDCYNANPTSCRAALESLAMLSGRKVAVLGDMLELGDNGPALHREIGVYAAKLGIRILACGPISKATAEGANGVWYESAEELIASLPENILNGDCVLVKASHGMHLERVVEALKTR